MNRLHNLDYLRGLAAFAIMFYHYFAWVYFQPSSDTFLGKLGIYGVSIFYILSGLTLFIVYDKKLKTDTFNIKDFFLKRIFRIFPLLWLATIITIIMAREIPDLYKLFINLTGLFGFVDWNNTFATGVWSIGNELTFYACFPFLLYLSNKKVSIFYGIAFLLFLLYCYFAFFLFAGKVDLYQNWSLYVNPINQVFLFTAGILIAKLLRDVNLNNAYASIFIILGVLIFTFLPASSFIDIVTEEKRLILTFCACLICLGFFKLTFILPKFIHSPLSILGEISYSVYLIHPIVFSSLGAFGTLLGISFNPIFKILLSIIVTLVASYVIYENFEKFFIKKGAALTTKSLIKNQ